MAGLPTEKTDGSHREDPTVEEMDGGRPIAVMEDICSSSSVPNFTMLPRSILLISPRLDSVSTMSLLVISIADLAKFMGRMVLTELLSRSNRCLAVVV